MGIEEKIIELAKMKTDAKDLEKKIKALQTELIEEGVATDFETPYGKLSFKMRESFVVADKITLIKYIGQKAYNAHSTISKTGIQKAVGELGFQEVLDKGLMRIKSVSQYFELRK
jgi:hypothetical protein